MADKKSTCVFCGSTSYGKNCPWSSFTPKIHLHTGDPTKCSFCGSSVKFGLGCSHSPTGKHMAGSNFFNPMVAEAFVTGLIMHNLSQRIEDTQAFKLGLINELGNVIKRPSTLEEQTAFSTIDKYLLKLKKLLGTNVGLLNNEMYLESAIKSSQVPIELYEKEVKLKSDMKMLMQRFFDTLNEARDNNLPLCVIEKIILESLI